MADSLNRPQTDVLRIWVDESQAIGEDIDRLGRQLADTNKWVSILALCLKDLMAVPIQGETLEQILQEVAKLKYAYEDAVRKFTSLQEDVRPIRRELYRVRGRVDAVEIVAEVAANEAARAVEPLLSNLYSQLSAEIDALRISISRPMERLATSIAQEGGLTPTLLQELVVAIREALAEMWRTTTSIGKFVDGAWARCSAALSVRVQDIESRVMRMEGIGGPVGEHAGSAVGAALSIPQLAAAIDSLKDRVRVLELGWDDADAMDRRVLESLRRMGFTDELLNSLRRR